MVKKLFLYGHTVWNMKPSQIYSRVKKKLGLSCTLGICPAPMQKQPFLYQPAIALDFDPVFLQRFPVDEFITGKVTFLHECESFSWRDKWKFENRSALWNFNLHYFEFLMSFVNAYKLTNDRKYLEAVETSISAWIDHNPKEAAGDGWASYTIALRVVHWLDCWIYLGEQMNASFKERMLESMYEQYSHLARNLEKDLLANHYFEDLKALVLCAVFFQDSKMLHRALTEFKKQCQEQILADGMHFELSPMYHKIILESLLRVALALRSYGKQDETVESYIKPMLDVAYTFEEGLERIPLFNDGGNNVAKSLNSLLKTVKEQFGLSPEKKEFLPESGYYFFERNGWRLIVDAGQPGPRYNPGHAHCDAMSFELFYAGKPVLVNCGTYAYQSDKRAFFRSTAAHNTVMVNGREQSQCWGAFRLGKRSRTKVMDIGTDDITMRMCDQSGSIVERSILLNDTQLIISDRSEGQKLRVDVHIGGAYEMDKIQVFSGAQLLKPQVMRCWYSDDYGRKEEVIDVVCEADSIVTMICDLT